LLYDASLDGFSDQVRVGPVVEMVRRFLASDCDNLANLLGREGSRTTRPGQIGQQGADRGA
jgi:hypothetical protein